MKTTHTGDKGETRLFNVSVSKSDHSVESLGNLDELNSFLGVCISLSENKLINGLLGRVQKDLLSIGSQIASHVSHHEQYTVVTKESISFLEKNISEIEKQLPELRRFILPNGTQLASMLHVARSVCRRTERRLVELSEHSKLDENILAYVNRLSDLLFSLARYANKYKGVSESEWKAE